MPLAGDPGVAKAHLRFGPEDEPLSGSEAGSFTA